MSTRYLSLAVAFTFFACGFADAQYQRKSPPAPRPMQHQPQQQKTKPATRPTGVKTYENQENQFSLRVPAAWTEAGGGSGANSNETLYSFTIEVPGVSNSTLVVRTASQDMPDVDLDAAVEAIKKKYPENNKDLKIRDVQKIKLAGEDARVLSVDNYQGAGSVERTTLTAHNGKLLAFVLDAPDTKSYQKSLGLSDGVIKSLKWLDKKPATQPAPATQAAPGTPTAEN